MKKLLPFIYLLGVAFIALLFSQFQPDKTVEELKVNYTDSRSKFIEVDGMQVHYCVEGKGSPLVLIHGTSSSLHTWEDWNTILKDHYTIIRMDIPGFGLTGPQPENNYSIEYYTEFINKFTQKIGLDTFYLAGNSLGGFISWHYALNYPEKVKKLILVDAAGYPKDKIPALFKFARMPILPDIMKTFTPKILIEKNLKQVYFDDSKITDDLVQRYFDLSLRTGNRDAFIHRVKAGFSSHYDEIKNIKTPTLIQWGKHDDWIPLKDAVQFNKDISGSILKVYDNAGHVPMEEIPLETAKDVLYFLQH
jgi:pimeloyl-ACP methyl ester carboxylesterase